MPAFGESPSQMTQSVRRRLRGAPPGLVLFFLAIALLSVGGGVWDSVYNNYLDDTFHIDATVRGQLEFPRELPGLLTAVMTGLFFFVADTGLGAVAAAAVALGMGAIALVGGQWWPMVGATLLWSIGTHLMMPVRDSVALGMAREGQQGRRLGQLGAMATLAAIGGYALVWLGERVLHWPYATLFAAGALVAGLSVVMWLVMPRLHAHPDRPRLVIKRRYWLFYVLSFLFGARKQIYITFGPWVLVRIFRQRPYVFAQLQTIGALVGVFFQPLLGRLIDRVGERFVLVGDAALVLLVSLAYGFAAKLGRPELGLVVACTGFVLDQVLFGVGMARTTYLAKIAERPEDLTPSLSLAVSINHLVSMSLPTLGGMVWDRFGYQWVFVGAAAVSLVNLGFAWLVRTPPSSGSAPVPEAPLEMDLD